MRHLHSKSGGGDGQDAFEIFDWAPPTAAQIFPVSKHFLFTLICLVWLFVGIFGRDPWKPEETLLSGLLVDDNGGVAVVAAFSHSLYLGLTALTAAATAAFLPIHEGARLANVLLLAVAMAAVGWCMRRQHGARTAWIAVLLLVGTSGLMVRGHQLSHDVFSFFAAAVVTVGMFVWLDSENRYKHALAGGVSVSGGIGLLLLNNDLLGALAALLAVLCFIPSLKNRAVFGCILAILLLPPTLWQWHRFDGAVPMFTAIADSWRTGRQVLNHLEDFLRVAGWSLFPVLPGAVAGVWLYRKNLAPFIKFCLLFIVFQFFNYLLSGQNEERFFILLAPLTVIAATMQKSFSDDASRVLDLFAVLVTGLFFCGGLWLVWFCLYTGNPAVVAEYLQERFPGYTLPPPSGWKVAVAAALAGGWVFLIQKFGHSKERATVNWACSMVLVWATFNLLLVGYVDSGKSYRTPAQAIAAHTAGGCVVAPAERHWRAQLRYFGVRLGGAECDFYLREGADDTDTADTDTVAKPLWTGGRGNEEKYRLYRRF